MMCDEQLKMTMSTLMRQVTQQGKQIAELQKQLANMQKTTSCGYDLKSDLRPLNGVFGGVLIS